VKVKSTKLIVNFAPTVVLVLKFALLTQFLLNNH